MKNLMFWACYASLLIFMAYRIGYTSAAIDSRIAIADSKELTELESLKCYGVLLENVD